MLTKSRGSLKEFFNLFTLEYMRSLCCKMGNALVPDRSGDDQRVLPQHMGGGPMNLGDPDDRTLRKIERDVIILNMVREKIRHEKCKEVGDILDKCGGEASWAIAWKCRKERDELLECSKRWFYSEELRNEATEEFLKQRSYYRRTGKPGYLYKEAEASAFQQNPV